MDADADFGEYVHIMTVQTQNICLNPNEVFKKYSSDVAFGGTHRTCAAHINIHNPSESGIF